MIKKSKKKEKNQAKIVQVPEIIVNDSPKLLENKNN